MITTLPTLRILPIDSVILHEDHDMQRSKPLIEKLRAAGIIRNPPIVMPLTDGSHRYMVLDGANRVTSLLEMEFPHIVAQVVQPNDPNVNLQTWNHVVWGMKSTTLLSRLKKIKGLKLKRVNTHKSVEAPKYVPMSVRLPDGTLYLLIEEPTDLAGHIKTLHAVVDTYKTSASRCIKN
jgi:hypothetical protein